MLWLQRPPSYMNGLPADLIEAFGADVLTQIQTPPAAEDPGEERRRLARTLVDAVGGEREPLERLRSRFIRRLRDTSTDLAATTGLRVTEQALGLIPRVVGT